jgi:hypothetical protein
VQFFAVEPSSNERDTIGVLISNFLLTPLEEKPEDNSKSWHDQLTAIAVASGIVVVAKKPRQRAVVKRR